VLREQLTKFISQYTTVVDNTMQMPLWDAMEGRMLGKQQEDESSYECYTHTFIVFGSPEAGST